MIHTRALPLFVIGALLMCVPALFTAGMKWAFAVFLIAGYAVLIVATLKTGGSKPGTALTLLLATNASFWLSYVLWLARLKWAGPSPQSGVDAFAGPVALWLILLLTLLLYEVTVFVRGFAANQERGIAVAGLVAAAAQVLITLRVAYNMVQGV